MFHCETQLHISTKGLVIFTDAYLANSQKKQKMLSDDIFKIAEPASIFMINANLQWTQLSPPSTKSFSNTSNPCTCAHFYLSTFQKLPNIAASFSDRVKGLIHLVGTNML